MFTLFKRFIREDDGQAALPEIGLHHLAPLAVVMRQPRRIDGAERFPPCSPDGRPRKLRPPCPSNASTTAAPAAR